MNVLELGAQAKLQARRYWPKPVSANHPEPPRDRCLSRRGISSVWAPPGKAGSSWSRTRLAAHAAQRRVTVGHAFGASSRPRASQAAAGPVAIRVRAPKRDGLPAGSRQRPARSCPRRRSTWPRLRSTPGVPWLSQPLAHLPQPSRPSLQRCFRLPLPRRQVLGMRWICMPIGNRPEPLEPFRTKRHLRTPAVRSLSRNPTPIPRRSAPPPNLVVPSERRQA
jgi:hypothetical protein